MTYNLLSWSHATKLVNELSAAIFDHLTFDIEDDVYVSEVQFAPLSLEIYTAPFEVEFDVATAIILNKPFVEDGDINTEVNALPLFNIKDHDAP